MLEHFFHFCGPITQKSYQSLHHCILNAICSQGAEKITILLSSEGGDLNSGFSAYSFLRGLPVPVKIINVGTIESMAVIMYLGADERITLEHSRFLLHQFHWTYPQQRVDFLRLYENSDSLNFDLGRYATIFNDRTNFGNGIIDITKCLNGQSVIVDTTTAIKCGISHDTIPIVGSIPAPSDNVVHWWIDTCS